jgi:hypothetical protein
VVAAIENPEKAVYLQLANQELGPEGLHSRDQEEKAGNQWAGECAWCPLQLTYTIAFTKI